jgi:hypothetical protein
VFAINQGAGDGALSKTNLCPHGLGYHLSCLHFHFVGANSALAYLPTLVLLILPLHLVSFSTNRYLLNSHYLLTLCLFIWEQGGGCKYILLFCLVVFAKCINSGFVSGVQIWNLHHNVLCYIWYNVFLRQYKFVLFWKYSCFLQYRGRFFFLLLFICAYKAWFISPPCPHPLPYHPLHPLPLPPTPSKPSRNYFALISNFVVERV